RHCRNARPSVSCLRGAVDCGDGDNRGTAGCRAAGEFAAAAPIRLAPAAARRFRLDRRTSRRALCAGIWLGSAFRRCVRANRRGFANEFDDKRERCWIAEMDGENVGSIILAKESETVARIRLLLVDPKARGLGLGRHLTDESIRFARDAGYRKMTLWTHSVLTAARHIYQQAGFKLMRSEQHESWGHPVIGEHWDLEL